MLPYLILHCHEHRRSALIPNELKTLEVLIGRRTVKGDSAMAWTRSSMIRASRFKVRNLCLVLERRQFPGLIA